jgi:hypothetical protein
MEDTEMINKCCTVLGANSDTKDGSHVVIIGYGNIVEGSRNIVIGNNNKVTGDDNVVIANDVVIIGDNHNFIEEAISTNNKDLVIYCTKTINNTMLDLINHQTRDG